MAVREKKSGWEVYYRDPATRKQRSRFFKTLPEAQREDRRIKYLLEFEPERLLKEDASRSGVEVVMKPVTPKQEKKDPSIDNSKYLFKNVAEEYLSYATIAESTKHVLSRYLRGSTFSTFLEMDVRIITSQMLNNYYYKEIKRGVKPQSIGRRLTELKSILTFAQSIGYIEEVPKFPKCAAGVATEFIPPTEEELSAMYNAASPMQKRIIILGARFGMRVGPCELLGLKWEDIDMEHWVIKLRAAKKNKRQPIRILPIPQQYRELFNEWYAQDTPNHTYVVYARTGKPYYCVQARVWNNLLNRAGISRHIRPYDLRHAFATESLRAGVDIGTVAKLMGHTGVQMIIKHYQYVSDKDKECALSRLSPLQT